jgi:hypothetical protein
MKDEPMTIEDRLTFARNRAAHYQKRDDLSSRLTAASWQAEVDRLTVLLDDEAHKTTAPDDGARDQLNDKEPVAGP